MQIVKYLARVRWLLQLRYVLYLTSFAVFPNRQVMSSVFVYLVFPMLSVFPTLFPLL